MSARLPSSRRCSILAVLAIVVCARPVVAEVSLPAIIGSNMVLQRDMPLPIWGWAKAGEKVTVTIGEQSASAVADEQGKWQVKLPAMKAGGPLEVTVAGENTIKLTNVLVGEVWLCSGQSNMVLPTGATLNAKDEQAAAKGLDSIRFFSVPAKGHHEPQKDVKGKWVVCDPGSAGGFSAVGYYFGRHVNKELKLPVGMICAAFNGSGIEPWMPPDAWQGDARLKAQFEKSKATDGVGDDYWRVSRLHNAMVAPLIPYGIRGLLWYQGETNAGGDKLYKFHFEGLVGAWRQMWAQGDFPVLFVQLPNYIPEPVFRFWIDFQEIQAQCLSIPNTGMAVTLDIGEAHNIHPANKQEVARRLWLNAAAKVYGQKDVEFSGPVFDSMKIDGAKAILSFTHVAGGLVAKGAADGKTLTGFVVGGADGKFAPANAVIEGDTVVVQADGIDKPSAVRYAWDLNPKCNLYNKAGLPAGVFRTDPAAASAMPVQRAPIAAVGVPMAKNEIKLDGDPADWKDIPAMPLPFMKKDSSGVKLCWREDGLYGLVVAKDQSISVSAKTPWTGDCFELFIEKDAAGRGERTAGLAGQWIFAPSPTGEDGAGLVNVAFGSEKASKFACQWKKTADGYALEFFIPAELLKPATMAAGTKLGCNFGLSDGGKPVELFYADKNANDGWNVPATWGLIELRN